LRKKNGMRKIQSDPFTPLDPTIWGVRSTKWIWDFPFSMAIY
jgi:hypothetical protein